MGMTSVSWFGECCSSCWISHDVNVVVSLSRRNVLEWRGRSVVGFVWAWLQLAAFCGVRCGMMVGMGLVYS